MKFQATHFSLFIFLIIFTAVCGNAVRTVVYRDGDTEDSSFEDDDLSPRVNAFGSFASMNRAASYASSNRGKTRVIVENGERDVVIIVRGSSETDQETSPNEFITRNSLKSKGDGFRKAIRQQRLKEWENLPDFSNAIDDDSDEFEPPPHQLVAKMARYIVHNTDWSSMATISTMSAVRGYPFVNIISVSDGPTNNSSGVPYFYMTSLDMSAIDLESDNRASLTMSLAETDYCKSMQYDPEDPRCAHVILSGHILPVTDKEELRFATNGLFTRHPEMKTWPKDHGWFFAKLDLKNVVVLDYFGGAVTVKLQDYFKQTLLPF